MYVFVVVLVMVVIFAVSRKKNSLDVWNDFTKEHLKEDNINDDAQGAVVNPVYVQDDAPIKNPITTI